jgi:hypothetical protein
LNVAAHLSELDRLRRIRDLFVPGGRALQLGESAGVPVHWAVYEDSVAAVIGREDIAWDIALIVPFEVIDRLIEAAAGLLPPMERSAPNPDQLELF